MNQVEQARELRRAGVEGRMESRHRCDEHTFVRFVVRPSFQSMTALVHDVSVNGIGFLIDKPLEAGAVLALQLRGGLPGSSCVRTAKVMHVRRHLPIPDAPWVRKKPFLKSLLSFFVGGQNGQAPEFVYLVGCRFTPPLAPNEVQFLCGVPQLD